MEEQKPLTWRELKEFINSIPEHQLDNDALVSNIDESPQYIYEADFREAVYYSDFDPEDVYFKEDFEMEVKDGNIENPEEYILDDSKPPYMSTNY